VRAIILGFAAGSHALYRLWRFHPACNQRYAAWLRLSPWTADKPLPLGPVHLVWQDVVLVGLIMAFAKWHAGVNPWVPIVVFGLVYFGGMTLLLAATGMRIHSLLLGILWPALILPVVKSWPIFVSMAMLAVVYHGHWAALRRFPWNPLVSARVRENTSSVWQTEVHILPGASGGMTSPKVGWPFMPLSPNVQKLQSASISLSTAVAVSLLIAWWTYCVVVRFQWPPMPAAILFFSVVAAVMRVVIYRAPILPPFNVWGRIASGRLIVPRFDQVLLTPVAVVIVGIAGATIIWRAGVWYAVAESCVIAVVTFVFLSGGPTLQKWMLTGQHRYRVPRVGGNRQVFQQI
jgi:hypothetical protein